MAIQTLNTIKNWFKTGLKPSQAQFWDTWDSFRHKFEKVPVKDIEGIDELLLTKADKTVLDNHLADKIAHAPQVNTDWNSASGVNQLLNKPDFKTINGEEIIGDGDITISTVIPTLDQVLNSDNKSLTQPILFLDQEHSSSIDSKNLSINGPLGEVIQYNGDNINWSKGDKNLKLLFDGESAGENTFSFPEMPPTNTPYKLATDQVVSATQSGIVDNTSLQELGGFDKSINGVRIGRGNNIASATNTALGSNALTIATTATNNTAVGRSTLALATTGGFNTAVGSAALTNLTTGQQNIGVGGSALRNVTTGNFNTAIGTSALTANIIGVNNTAIGSATGGNITGNNNTAVGYLAMGMSNVVSTGNLNIAIGQQAGGQLTSGSNNVLIENQQQAINTVTSGSNNVIVKQGLISTGVTTGSNNTIIGNVTGLSSDASNLAMLSDGSGNIALRKEADNRLLAPTLTNALIDSGGNKSLVTKEYLDAHSGGGGTTPNINQVLTAGNIVVDHTLQFNDSAPSGYYTTANIYGVATYSTEGDARIGGNTARFYDSSNFTFLGITPSTVKWSGLTGVTELKSASGGTGTSTLLLPAKNGMIATLDDITGGSQDLQQTLDNGNTSNIDLVIKNEYGQTQLSPYGIVRLLGDDSVGNQTTYSFDGISTYMGTTANSNVLSLTGRTESGVYNAQFNKDKPEGTYTIATLDDITGGSQNLQQTLDNGNEAINSNIHFKNDLYESDLDGSTFQFINGSDPDEQATTTITDGTIYYTKGAISKSIDFKTLEGSATFLLPDKEGDQTLATLDDIPLVSASNLNDVLNNGNTSDRQIILENEQSPTRVSTNNISSTGMNIRRIDDIVPLQNDFVQVFTNEISLGIIDNLGNGTAIAGFTRSLNDDGDVISGVLFLNNPDGSNSSIQTNPLSNGSGNYYLPNNTTLDAKTLATTEDISLQKVVDKNDVATKGNSYIGILNGSSNTTEIQVNNEGLGTDSSPLEVTRFTQNNHIILSSTIQTETNGNQNAVLDIVSDNINMSVIGGGVGGGNSTKVSFRAPENPNTELYFPSLPNISGGYDLATTKDITLQNAVNNNHTATNGASFANIIGAGGYGGGTEFFADNGLTGTNHRYGGATIDSEYVGLFNNRNDGDIQTSMEFNAGNISLEVKKDMLTSPKTTRLSFEAPIAQGVEIVIPAKPQRPELYKLATEDVFMPKITYVSTADYSVPEGYANRYITVSLGSGHTITLPSVSSSVGSMYHVTGNIAGFNYLATTGSLDEIMYQGVTFNEYEIARNTGVILINDGIHWVVVGRYPW